jgi:hypothetical protein
MEPAEENGRPSKQSICSPHSALIIALFQEIRLPQTLERSSCTKHSLEHEHAKIGARPATTSLFVDSTVSIFLACRNAGVSWWALKHSVCATCRVVIMRRAAVRHDSDPHIDLHRLACPDCNRVSRPAGKRGGDEVELAEEHMYRAEDEEPEGVEVPEGTNDEPPYDDW